MTEAVENKIREQIKQDGTVRVRNSHHVIKKNLILVAARGTGEGKTVLAVHCMQGKALNIWNPAMRAHERIAGVTCNYICYRIQRRGDGILRIGLNPVFYVTP
jgi:hypothetical protein